MPLRSIVAKNSEHLRAIVRSAIKNHGPNVDLNRIDVSNITDFSSVFSMTKFVGDISKWDVSKGTRFSHMFLHCPFTGDLSTWSVGQGKEFDGMFAHSDFNNAISQWDMSNATTLENMFNHSMFNGDISQWSVSNVLRAHAMFLQAAFDGDLSSWRFAPSILDGTIQGEASVMDFVAHHQPGARKQLRLPTLDVPCIRLFLSKDTMHAWLAQKLHQGELSRYHWDALLAKPDADWATPEMKQFVQVYLSMQPDASQDVVPHAALLHQSWQRIKQPQDQWPLPSLDETVYS